VTNRFIDLTFVLASSGGLRILFYFACRYKAKDFISYQATLARRANPVLIKANAATTWPRRETVTALVSVAVVDAAADDSVVVAPKRLSRPDCGKRRRGVSMCWGVSL
jgi:hypothetical protein